MTALLSGHAGVPKAHLRIQVARHGRSMEEVAPTIDPALRHEAQHPVTAGKGLGSRIHAHFAQLGGMELELPERFSLPTPAEFESDAELES